MTAKKTATKASPAEELKKKPAAKTAAAEAPAKATKAAAKPAAKATAVTDEDKPKRGRKPKAVTETKKVAGKKEAEEEDFVDVEAEIEGEEPEAVEEVAAVEEDTPKAKPLRMKVSRAKERALMREFGLEETALTEEEAAKRRQELKTLIKMGKTRGFLTHQEINDHLPEKLVNEEILEAIVSMLNDMGIAVYEHAPDAETLLLSDNVATVTSDDEAAAEAALSTVDSDFGRTTDPVRMYMREMGSVELLTREGEIEIAKRIEDGFNGDDGGDFGLPGHDRRDHLRHGRSDIQNDETKIDGNRPMAWWTRTPPTPAEEAPVASDEDEDEEEALTSSKPRSRTKRTMPRAAPRR